MSVWKIVTTLEDLSHFKRAPISFLHCFGPVLWIEGEHEFDASGQCVDSKPVGYTTHPSTQLIHHWRYSQVCFWVIASDKIYHQPGRSLKWVEFFWQTTWMILAPPWWTSHKTMCYSAAFHLVYRLFTFNFITDFLGRNPPNLKPPQLVVLSFHVPYPQLAWFSSSSSSFFLAWASFAKMAFMKKRCVFRFSWQKVARITPAIDSACLDPKVPLVFDGLLCPPLLHLFCFSPCCLGPWEIINFQFGKYKATSEATQQDNSTPNTENSNSNAQTAPTCSYGPNHFTK